MNILTIFDQNTLVGGVVKYYEYNKNLIYVI